MGRVIALRFYRSASGSEADIGNEGLLAANCLGRIDPRRAARGQVTGEERGEIVERAVGPLRRLIAAR
jgi:hypothetical protein